MPSSEPLQTLHTATGALALEAYHLSLQARSWTILHTGAVLSHEDEQRFLGEEANRAPYGVALWPAAIALAHELASRADSLRGIRVLELGAGTGLPGIVAASLGARVVQTDRHELALSLCRHNGERNEIVTIEHRLADWTAWADDERYALIIGSDILYAERLHASLRGIFDRNLRAGGSILVADPFRQTSVRLLEAMERDGWTVGLTKWRVQGESTPRPIGVFELTPPDGGIRSG